MIEGDRLVIPEIAPVNQGLAGGLVRINSGTGPELVVRARDCLGFKWGWHGIGANRLIGRSYLDQVSGGGGEDSAAAPTLD